MTDDKRGKPTTEEILGDWNPPDDFEQDCWHTIIVSISPTECQCTGCLRIWPKEPDFKSDAPNQDRG